MISSHIRIGFCALVALFVTFACDPNAGVDTTPPTAATSLATSVSNGSVFLAWINSSDNTAEGFLLTRSVGPTTDLPVNGTEYQLGDTFGDATVITKGITNQNF